MTPTVARERSCVKCLEALNHSKHKTLYSCRRYILDLQTMHMFCQCNVLKFKEKVSSGLIPFACWRNKTFCFDKTQRYMAEIKSRIGSKSGLRSPCFSLSLRIILKFNYCIGSKIDLYSSRFALSTRVILKLNSHVVSKIGMCGNTNPKTTNLPQVQRKILLILTKETINWLIKTKP